MLKFMFYIISWVDITLDFKYNKSNILMSYNCKIKTSERVYNNKGNIR